MIDVHQHLWPEALCLALEQRSEPPFARRYDGAWEIFPGYEPAFTVSETTHGTQARVDAVTWAGLDRALVALSSPVGIETLPAREAQPLLDAWDTAARELPRALEPWAAVSLEDPDPAQLAAALDAGAAGLCLPAPALAGPAAIDRLGPVLGVLEAHLAPLFIHPGQTAQQTSVDWWAPVTDYVSQLHAAWHAFVAWGRPAHPRLSVVFAALAGLAPLHHERSAARGGPVLATPDPLIFYEPSSYGARALRTMAATVGVSQLVHGTDEPVVSAPHTRPLGADAHEAMATTNVARLLGRTWSA